MPPLAPSWQVSFALNENSFEAGVFRLDCFRAATRTTMRSLLLPITALILLLCSCVTQTPQTRIANDPAAYAALSPEHQDLVSRGLIAKGMPKSGVLIALGTPSRQSHGFRDGTAYERWDYTRLQPVYTGAFFGSYYGSCGYYPGGYGLTYAPAVQYIPQRDASVLFRQERVHAWDQVSSPYRY